MKSTSKRAPLSALLLRTLGVAAVGLVGLAVLTGAGATPRAAASGSPQTPASFSAPPVSPVHLSTTKPKVSPHLVQAYGKLPLSFEVNQGQTDPQVKFLSRGSGYTLFLTGDETVLALKKSSVVSGQSSVVNGLLQGTSDNRPGTTDSVLRMKLVGANPNANVTGTDQQAGKSNYFIGNDPKTWRTNVPNYGKVKYAGVYPGVDLVYYGHQQQLEYDFVVAPGVDPNVIKLDVGADRVRPPEGERRLPLRITADGDLVVKTDGGEVRFHKPVVYQSKSTANYQSSIDNRQLLEGRYFLMGKGQVGFEIAAYDHGRPLARL